MGLVWVAYVVGKRRAELTKMGARSQAEVITTDQRTTAQTVETRIDEAIQRMQIYIPDSSLFIQTVSKLVRLIWQVTSLEHWHHNPDGASSSSSIMPATPSLVVGPTGSLQSVRSWVMGQEWISLILMKDAGSASLGLDALLVIDSSCADIAGLGGKAKGTRVELMAATARDGRTFTQHW